MNQALIDNFMKTYTADAVLKTANNLDVYALNPLALAEHHALEELPSSAQDLRSSFDELPLELHQNIAGRLDLASVINLRCAFASTKQAIDALPEVARILKHARNVLSCAIALGCAHRITVTELHKKLEQTTCDTCGSLAAFLDIRTFSRQCLQFGSECKPRHVAQTAQQIRRNYRLTATQFAKLDNDKHRFQSIRGVYGGLSQQFEDSRVTLYDGEAAAKLASHRVPASRLPDDEQLQHKLTAVRAVHFQAGESVPRRVMICSLCKNASIKRMNEANALSAYWAGETEIPGEEKYQPSEVALVFVEDFNEHGKTHHSRK